MNPSLRTALLCLLISCQLIACATMPAKTPKLSHTAPKPSPHRVISQTESDNQILFRTVLHNKMVLPTPAAKVLETAQAMLDKGIIVQGSCWDYISTVYEKAGVNGNRLVNVYWQKIKGPYVDPSQIQAGDWVMFRNFSFNNIDHSAIFVAWVDQAANIALTVSYVGQDRAIPGRLYQYDLTECFGIRRAQ